MTGYAFTPIEPVPLTLALLDLSPGRGEAESGSAELNQHGAYTPTSNSSPQGGGETGTLLVLPPLPRRRSIGPKAAGRSGTVGARAARRSATAWVSAPAQPGLLLRLQPLGIAAGPSSFRPRPGLAHRLFLGGLDPLPFRLRRASISAGLGWPTVRRPRSSRPRLSTMAQFPTAEGTGIDLAHGRGQRPASSRPTEGGASTHSGQRRPWRSAPRVSTCRVFRSGR